MKRSNPKRNSPHAPAPPVDYETGDVPAKTRSASDFAGSTSRKVRRGVVAAVDAEVIEHERGRAPDLKRETARRARGEGEHGSFPGSEAPPRPPPVFVWYEDLADPADMPQAVYGQYPRVLIPKALPWLRCERHQILHVCSGALPPGEGIRVDIRPEAKPDILADGRALPLPDGSQVAVLIDPPYTPHYARELYGVDYPRPSHLLREAARVVRPGGRIGFVHYITPKPPPGTVFVRAFGMSTGFDMPIRAVTFYERDGGQPELELGGGDR